MNFCEYCEGSTPSSKTTIRVTKDGREIFVKICENCGLKTEVEFYKGSTIRFKTGDKKSGKRTHRKNKRLNV